MDRNAQIWWGAITSARQAREIIAWAAWSLIVIGAAPAASLAVAGLQRRDHAWPRRSGRTSATTGT